MLMRSTQAASPHSQMRSRDWVLRSNVSARPSIRSFTSRKTASFNPMRSSRELISSARLLLGDVLFFFDDDIAVLSRDHMSDSRISLLVAGDGEEVVRMRPDLRIFGQSQTQHLRAGRERALA